MRQCEDAAECGASYVLPLWGLLVAALPFLALPKAEQSPIDSLLLPNLNQLMADLFMLDPQSHHSRCSISLILFL
jgi:hypothetical protein